MMVKKKNLNLERIFNKLIYQGINKVPWYFYINFMIKKEYENLPDTEFIPLKDGIDEAFWGKYEINKLGQVRNTYTGQLLVIKTYNTDYPRIRLSSSTIREKNYFIHKLLAQTFLYNDDPVDKVQVNHVDRNKMNWELSNLEWVTVSENLKKRGKLNSWDRIKFQKLDDKGNVIETLNRDDFSFSVRHNLVSKYIPKHIKYNGYFWEKIDLEVEEYYKNFNAAEKSAESWLPTLEDPNIYVSNLGLVRTRRGITIGHANDFGYRTINIKKGSHKKVHDLVYEAFVLKRLIKRPEVIDHISTNHCDNRLSNLKLCNSQKENMNNPVTKSKLKSKKRKDKKQ